MACDTLLPVVSPHRSKRRRIDAARAERPEPQKRGSDYAMCLPFKRRRAGVHGLSAVLSRAAWSCWKPQEQLRPQPQESPRASPALRLPDACGGLRGLPRVHETTWSHNDLFLRLLASTKMPGGVSLWPFLAPVDEMRWRRNDPFLRLLADMKRPGGLSLCASLAPVDSVVRYHLLPTQCLALASSWERAGALPLRPRPAALSPSTRGERVVQLWSTKGSLLHSDEDRERNRAWSGADFGTIRPSVFETVHSAVLCTSNLSMERKRMEMHAEFISALCPTPYKRANCGLSTCAPPKTHTLTTQSAVCLYSCSFPKRHAAPDGCVSELWSCEPAKRSRLEPGRGANFCAVRALRWGPSQRHREARQVGPRVQRSSGPAGICSA